MGRIKKQKNLKKPRHSNGDSGVRKRAIVSRVFGAYYEVRDASDPEETYLAVLRGKLRLEKRNKENRRFRHLLMPGDLVETFVSTRTADSNSESEKEARIESLEPRKNALFRSSPHEDHGLGANLDLAVCVISLADPRPRFGFLDRFLTSCQSGNVTPLILFTKQDRFESMEDEFIKEEIQERVEDYKRLGYRPGIVNLLSSEDQPDLMDLQEKLSSGVTLLAGNSGTGKSTLINRLMGYDAQKTSNISDSSGKGKHTTTNSTMFLYPPTGSFIIDTPGVKEWGVHHLDRQGIFESFRELSPFAHQCKFRNCDHSENVEGCEVQNALDRSIEYEQTGEGERIIHPGRLQSLMSMLESLEMPDRIRTGDYIKPTGRMRNQME